MSTWAPPVVVAPDPVVRPRLLARLDALLPLTVIRAPAGFGKTTLIRQWLAGVEPDVRVATVRVRPSGDRNAFWLGVIDALTDAGLPLPLLADRRPPQSTAERMLTAASEPVLLWIDSFEDVPPDRADDVLVDIVQNAPHIRLVVCLRSTDHFTPDSDVDLPATRVDARELLFTVAETAEIFASGGHPLSTDDLEAVHAETGGWAQPLKALSVALRSDAAAAADVRTMASTLTAHYLRTRLLPEATSSDRTDFALVMSVPDEFPVELAELLSGDPGVPKHIDWLVGQGLLGLDTVDGNVVYRWPDGARRALAAELQRRTPDRLPELQARLARWYVGHDQPALALQNAVRAADWVLAVQIIHTYWRRLLFHHRDELYDAVLHTPLDMIVRSPRAVAMRALFLQVADDHLLSLANLPFAPVDLADLGGAPDAADRLDTGLAALIALRDRGLFDLAVDHGERLLQVAMAARAAHPSEVADLYAAVHLFVGQVQLAAGGAMPAAIQCFTEAYRRSGDSPMSYVEADAAGKLAMSHALDGTAREAASWLERGRRAPEPDTWLSPMIRSAPATARLLIAVDTLNLSDAAVAAATLTGRLYRDHFWALHIYARALHALHAGTAISMLDELDRWTSERPDRADAAGAAPLLAAAEADLLLALGRGNQARSILFGAHKDHPLLHLGQARLALLSDQPDEAVRLATDTGWQRVAINRHRHEMLVVHAIALDRLDDRAGAVEVLIRAVELSRSTGAWRPFATAGRAALLALDVPAMTDAFASAPLHEAAQVFPDRVRVVRLTPREQHVLERIATGLSMHQVANALRVSYSTVRTQQRSLYRKLEVESQPDAVARARQLGLLMRAEN